MSKRRSRSQRRSSAFTVSKKRTGLRTFIETFMGVAAGLVIIAFAGWWYFVREAPEQIDDSAIAESVVKENLIDSVENYNAILQRGELDQMLRLAAQLEDWRRDAETPVRLDTLARRRELAEKIIEHPDLTESQRVNTAKTILNSMGQYYGICFDERIFDEGDTVAQYLEICRRFMNDPDEEVAKDAHLSNAKVLVYELTRGNEDASSSSIRQAIADLISSYPNDNTVMDIVQLLLKRVKNVAPVSGEKLAGEIVAEYDTADVSDRLVAKKLRDLKDIALLESSGITELSTQAQQSNDFEAYLDKLFELIADPDTGIEFVNRIYLVVAYFEITGRYELARRVLLELQKSTENRTDPLARQQATRVSSYGLVRNDALGKRFDLSDTDARGNALDLSQFENRPCLITFYSPNSPQAAEIISRLEATYQLVSRTDTKFIVVTVDQPMEGQTAIDLNPEWIAINNDPNQKSGIFERCPVSHVPYWVLIDKSGSLVALNVPAEQLKTRIEAVASEPLPSDN